MQINGTLILLYFIEMLPSTVSSPIFIRHSQMMIIVLGPSLTVKSKDKSKNKLGKPHKNKLHSLIVMLYLLIN